MKLLLRLLLRIFYRFHPHNEAVLKEPGPVLLLPNHVSWWDWLLLGVCLEDDWRFVTSSQTAAMSWLHKRVMVNRRTFPVDMNSPYAVKHIAEYLQRGGRLVMFPEGRLSHTGSLMKLFEGTGFLLHKTGARVITAYLRGTQRLPFSPNPYSKQWFPALSVHFSEVFSPPKFPELSVTVERARLTEWVRELMVWQQFETEMKEGPATVPAAILLAARRCPGRIVLEDATAQKLTYRRLLLGADLLGQQWNDLAAGQSRLGVLLPNVNAMAVVLLSVWAADRVPVVLNYSSGTATLLACARLAGLKQIITSKKFLSRLNIEPGLFAEAGIELLLLEDVRTRITGVRKLLGWLRQRFGPTLRNQANPARSRASEPAVILFTSGSEGEPKGVELTHANLLANMRQMLAVIDLVESDRAFNALPLFHSFGLTVGLLLPLTEGIFTFLYVSPLHYRIVPAAFYNLDCTILFGTNTFLSGYARKAHPYDFRTLRYVFAGAEKVHESTRIAWMNKFGVRILEGYGVTECSPVLSVNVPVRSRPGSVGPLVPGVEIRIEPVEGIESPRNPADGPAGRLFVRGPNIMRGYLNPGANAGFQSLGGWYDTGDIARMDTDGFLHIVGRLKRFAKISGEMVSLAAVEEALLGGFPQYGPKFTVAVLARRDEQKGERLLAVTNEPALTLEQVREAVKAHGLSNLAIPRELKCLHEIPLLATGKIDFRKLEQMV